MTNDTTLARVVEDAIVERVAEAMSNVDWNKSQPWDRKHDTFKDRYRDMARAALTAAGMHVVRAEDGEVERLRKALTEARRAIGDHYAPNDCYATGPMTGDAYRDLVQCPACFAIPLIDAALTPPASTEKTS